METNNPSVPRDTEDKSWWLLHGENLEHRFVEICVENLKLNMAINPEKELDPTKPDLLVNGKLADLKTQNTPFFTSYKYGVDPRFAVTFNRKDYERYRSLYPSIDIYFWVDWQQLVWRDHTVKYFGGIFRLPFSSVGEMIESGAPEHAYCRRKDDARGNAKTSFVLDVRNFDALFVNG